MKIYLIIVHIIMSLYLGGGIVLSLAHQFKTDWGMGIKDFTSPWKKFSYLWVILFIPLLFFTQELFPWSEFHGNKEVYFTLSYVILRLFFYWIGTMVATLFIERKPYLSLIIYFFIGNFLAFDWAMSLEGHWFSNMYGFLYLASGVAGAISFFIMTKFEKTSKKGRIDLSHLLITTTIIWLYLNFSQFIIMWMANLPREVIWYIVRFDYLKLLYGFMILKILPLLSIAFFHDLKTSPKVMRIVSSLTFLGSLLEMFWIIYPGGHS